VARIKGCRRPRQSLENEYFVEEPDASCVFQEAGRMPFGSL
jgi:hypothetical protein